MRLLHVHSGNRYGGVESVLRVMARPNGSLRSVFALCFDGRLANQIRAGGGEVCILGQVRASRPFSVLRARSILSRLFRQRRFDATLVHSAWALSLLAQGSKPPLIFYQHDIFQGTHWTEKLARRFRPDLILANSAFTAQTTSLVFPGRPVQVVYPPANLPAETLPGVERQAMRSGYAVPDQGVVILIAARFEKWKGHGLLLEGLALLRHNSRWHLWIAGEPQNYAELQVRARLQLTAAGLGLSGRVHFLGHVSNIPALMQAADIYCQPNTAPEPFGLAFVEALASGLPVVATPLGGVREILEPSWGLLAAPQPRDIAAALARLLEDPGLRERLGEAGRARAVELCDPETQIAAVAHAIAQSGAWLRNRKVA